MHLTNYAINKQNENYVQNDNRDGGTGTNFGQALTKEEQAQLNSGKIPEEKAHKRSLKQVFTQIEQQLGLSTKQLVKDIRDLVVKTCITGECNLF